MSNAEDEFARDYVDGLIEYAMSHRAVRHPYLLSLRGGRVPDPVQALTDLSHQYLAYSSQFPRYLAATIAQVEDPRMRAKLLRNLAEESGELDKGALVALRARGIDPEWAQGIPHPMLYRRFLAALDIDETWLERHPFSDHAIAWSSLFLLCCQASGPAVAIGALGLGTEAVVSSVYAPMIEAIDAFLPVSRRDRVFFELHCTVDDEHGEVLREIAINYALRGPNERAGLRLGTVMALNLRASFFDAMLANAQRMPDSPSGPYESVQEASAAQEESLI